MRGADRRGRVMEMGGWRVDGRRDGWDGWDGWDERDG